MLSYLLLDPFRTTITRPFVMLADPIF